MRIGLVTLALLGWFGTAFGQPDRSSLTGTVTDQQGGRVRGVSVRAVQRGTGMERVTLTSADGGYGIAGLPIGVYSLTFSKDGFQTQTVDRVEQGIGAVRTLNVQLNVGVVSESAQVRDAVVRLETSGAALGEAFENIQISELPLNGRNWSHLTALVPGAVDTGSSDQRSIRFVGHGLDDNNFTVDGVDASGVLNQAHKQYVRLAIPLESIGEFQVRTQNFSADTGETGGGQVAVTSAAGTNAMHGSAFDYLRNSAFDARSPFDGSSPAPFVLNQFGGSVSGPLVRNRAFFSANYEGLRQRRGQTQIGLTPSPSFAARVADQSPALKPVLAAFPQGTSAVNANVWNYVAGANQVDNEDSGTVRLDWHLTARTTGFVRFSADEADYIVPTGALNVRQATTDKLRNGVVELLHVFSSQLINESRFGINQDQYHVASLSGVPFAVRVSGLSQLGASNTSDGQGTTYNWLNDTTWTRGRHTVKFGAQYRILRIHQGNSQNGTLTYTSLANFATNTLDSASYTAQLPLKRLGKFKVFGYLQDEIRLTPRLTLNVGLRYSFFNVLRERDNRAIPFDLETCGGYCPASAPFTNPRYNDFDPRLGIAWSRGNTVLRVGAGLYHTDGQEDDQNLPYQNDVQRYSLTAIGSRGLAFPIEPFLATSTGIVTPRDLYRNRKDFYISSWTASVQQVLPGSVVATAAYAANKGTNVLTTTYQNAIDPATGTRPYPNFGIIEFRKNDSNSTFQSFQLSARRTFSKDLSLLANYMWSHSINDGGIGGGDSDVPQNIGCRACDRASSDFDVRHVLNATSVYQLPWRRGDKIFGGWQLSGVISARSGLPVNVTVDRPNSALPNSYSVSGAERPNLIPGVSLIPTGGSTPGLWINPAAFTAPADGTFGNAGRNLARGPRLWQVDTSVSKLFPVTERLKVQFRAEAYNLFNRAQYANPAGNLGSVTGGVLQRAANFGQITTPVNQGATGGGTPRQFQFALRLLF